MFNAKNVQELIDEIKQQDEYFETIFDGIHKMPSLMISTIVISCQIELNKRLENFEGKND